jgi:hypothetical protein
MAKKIKRYPLDLMPHFAVQYNGMVYDFAVDMEERQFDCIILFDGWWRVSSKTKVVSRWGREA